MHIAEPVITATAQEQTDDDPFGQEGGFLGFDDDGQGPEPTVQVTEIMPAPTETARERLARLRRGLEEKKAARTLKREDFCKGGKIPHATHALQHHRGLVWCWRCAAYGADKLQKLAEVCRPELTEGTKSFLRRLKNGLTPRPEMDWPLDEGLGPPSGPLA